MSTAQGHFQNPTPNKGIWHSLNRVLGTLIVLVLAALIAFRFTPELSNRRIQQARLDKLNAEVEVERQKLALNTRAEEFLRHNSDYLGLIARDRLDLMKEGETIYRFEPARADKAKMRLIR